MDSGTVGRSQGFIYKLTPYVLMNGSDASVPVTHSHADTAADKHPERVLLGFVQPRAHG